MDKLKKVSISALAGTLVSLSAAQAGGVSVSGSYELSYTHLDHTKVDGQKLGVNKNITFGAGGDLSDGGAVTWATTVAMNDGFSGLSSASMSINMGGIATLTYDSGTGGTGANAVDNIVPTAWEEVDYGFKTGISDVGAVSASKGVVNLTVKAPVAGTGISISYASGMSAGHISDGATAGADGNQGIDLVIDFVDYDAAHAGFRWGVAGQVELPERTCENERKSLVVAGDQNSCSNGHKHEPYAGSMFTKMQLGPLHLGAQATFKNPANAANNAIMNQRSVVGGIAAIFGDTLSLSYGIAYDKYRYNDKNRGLPTQVLPYSVHAGGGGDKFEYVTQKYQGYSAAINLGPVALKGTRNHVYSDKANSVYKDGVSHSEINLSIAF
jgi:hypothetical protein